MDVGHTTGSLAAQGPFPTELRPELLEHNGYRNLDSGELTSCTGLVDQNRRLARLVDAVFDPQGQALSRYDKIHLFRFDNGRESYDESAVLSAGDTPTAWSLPDGQGESWRVGMSICYDLRFGELYRALAADVLLVPAAFTHTTGQDHWEVLLRARAIENQAYVIASAQGGTHDNGRRTWGHSMVIDPWGEVLVVHADGPGFALAEIDRSRLRSVRSQLPALQHRRL